MADIPKQKNVKTIDIKVDGKNPNRMSEYQKEALKDGIRRWGFIVPIVTNKDLVLADGEHRLEAAKSLGMEEVPAVVLDVDEVDRRLLRQVMNKLKGQHDPIVDSGEFQFLAEGGRDTVEFAKLMGLSHGEFLNSMEHSMPSYAEKEVSFVATEKKCPKCGYEW